MHGVALIQCTPIIGIDLWEHAYIVSAASKGEYFERFWAHLDWPRISHFFESHNLAKKVAPIIPE